MTWGKGAARNLPVRFDRDVVVRSISRCQWDNRDWFHLKHMLYVR